MPSLRRVFSLLASFLLGLSSVGIALSSFIGEEGYLRPDERYVRKLADLSGPESDVSMIFIGSSRMERGINPAVFDEAAAELGWEVRSYNMSLASMSLHEERKIVQDILARDLPRLRYLVIEPMFDRRIHYDNVGTWRNLYFSDRQTFDYAVDYLWGTSLKLRQKAGRTATLLPTHVLRNLCYGGLPGVLIPTIPARPEPPNESLPALRGYKYALDPPGIDETLIDLTRGPRAPRRFPYEPVLDRYVELVGLLAEHGIETVFVVPPRLNGHGYQIEFLAAAEARSDIDAISYLDQRRYPDIYRDPEHWYNGGHLGHSGATVFSAVLAADFLERRTVAAALVGSGEPR